MKFSQTVCTASYSIIHFGDDFYIWSRKEAKYQIRHLLLTSNDKILRKKHLPHLRKIWEYLQMYWSIFKAYELHSYWEIWNPFFCYSHKEICHGYLRILPSEKKFPTFDPWDMNSKLIASLLRGTLTRRVVVGMVKRHFASLACFSYSYTCNKWKLVCVRMWVYSPKTYVLIELMICNI